jgi:preprotein translocase SecE subunit
MATAVQTSSQTRTSNPRVKLALASLFAAVFIIAGVVIAGYLVPLVWERVVAPALGPLGSLFNATLRDVVQLIVIGVFIWGGTMLAGAHPPRGIRGGIFLVISLLIAIFFITRAVGLNLEDSSAGLPITLAVLVVLLVASGRFLVSPKAEGWMTGLEDQGWFSLNNYKRTQGIRARRYTLLGILLIGWSGVYSLMAHEAAGHGDWLLTIPFTGEPHAKFVALANVQYSVPLLLAVLTFWVAWRTVNVPVFADFLIATEAEMNKVSWSTRRRLIQDTIVVLVTVALLTLFLLVVDLFWGWLLSVKYIGVLPPHSAVTAPAETGGGPANW